MKEDEWWPACPDTAATGTDSTVSARDECNASHYQFWNEVLCQCQLAYHVECATSGAAPVPCDAPQTPGLYNTQCECVDVQFLYSYYPSWASDDLIDRAQRN